jgi:hypothetical protein
MRRFVVALSILFALTPAAGAAPPENFVANLSGGEEVPPRDTRARGEATFTLDDTGMATYRLIVANIENVVQAHIHCGAAGTNGPVRVFLYGPVAPGGGRINGVIGEGGFDANDQDPCPTPPQTFLEAMRSGNTYVNVHTDDGDTTPNEGPGDFPGGEIRGQLVPRGS